MKPTTPSALCAILQLLPQEARDALDACEAKGRTSESLRFLETLMFTVLYAKRIGGHEDMEANLVAVLDIWLEAERPVVLYNHVHRLWDYKPWVAIYRLARNVSEKLMAMGIEDVPFAEEYHPRAVPRRYEMLVNKEAEARYYRELQAKQRRAELRVVA